MAFNKFFTDKASNENTQPRILLTLQGGGSHGAFTAGVIKALEENGILADVQGVIGTSAGANNAACVGYALNAGDTALATSLSRELWEIIGKEGDKISHLKSFARATSFTKFPNLPESFVAQMKFASQTGSMLGAKSQAGHVRDHIDDVIKDWDVIQNGNIPVLIGAALKSGGNLVEYNFTNSEIDEHAIAASSCISGSYIINGKVFIDGGNVKNPPIQGAFDPNEYTDVLAIQLYDVPDEAGTRLQEDITDIQNEFIGPEVYEELAYLEQNTNLNVHAIGMEYEPHWNQTSKLNFVSRWIDDLYDRGYQAGLEWAAKHKKDLGVRSSFTPDILDNATLQTVPQVA